MRGEALFMARLTIPRQKSWPLQQKPSAEFVESLRKHKSLRFADSEGLPLVTIVNIQRSDSCDSLSSLSSAGTASLSGEGGAPSSLSGSRQWLSSVARSSLLSGWGSSSAHPALAGRHEATSQSRKKLRFEQKQPSSSPDFHRILQRNLVTVENVASRGMTVFATVRVRNIAYEKSVSVRYSVDAWKTSLDVPATYVSGSCDGPTDRFSFTIVLKEDFPAGSKVQFAVCFQAAGGEFWDNNGGSNYSIVCEEPISAGSS